MATLDNWVFDKSRFMRRFTLGTALGWFVFMFFWLELPAEFLASWFALGLASFALLFGWLSSLGMWRLYVNPQRERLLAQRHPPPKANSV